MIKNTALRILNLILFISIINLTNSCKKKSDVDVETQSVVDNSICEQEFMQIQPTTNNLAIKTKGTGALKLASGSALLATCDTLTYLGGDTTYLNLNNPPIFEFDFGSCSAANFDGVVRTGKLTVKFIGRPKNANSKAIIKLQNYKVNGTISYSCDSIVVTTQPFTSTTRSFRVEVINASCAASGWWIAYRCDKTITIDNGNTPGIFNDDKTSLSGTSSGTNRVGKKFEVVVNQITKPFNCKYITSGTLELTPEGLSKRTVDYGNGACDDDATYTVNGQTIAFKLK